MIIPIDIHGLQTTPVFEYRTRLERRTDPDFNDATGDSRSEWDHRLRVGFDVKRGKDLTGEFRFQYSQETFWTEPRNYSHESRDLLLAHLDWKKGENTYSIGRQIITKGDRRLLDASNFGQRNKVFDVLRFRNARLDAFAGRVGIAGANENDHSKIAGATYDTTLGQSLVFWKRDDSELDSSIFTLDQRKVFQFGLTSLAVEGAYQFGKTGGLDQDAWWLHARVNHPLNKRWKVYAEGNVATGGKSADKSKLFDPLYGTNHAPYGLMDIESLRNMKQFEIGVTAALGKRLNFLACYNHYYLYDETDRWYGPSVKLQDPTGKAGSDVGQEFDISFDYALAKTQSLTLELGLFTPGPFVDRLVKDSANQYWGLLTYNTRF